MEDYVRSICERLGLDYDGPILREYLKRVYKELNVRDMSASNIKILADTLIEVVDGKKHLQFLTDGTMAIV